MAELIIETGNTDPARVPVTEGKPLILGRSPEVDLQIADTRLSRQHCKIELVGQKLQVTDLNSSNGTFAKGQRITTVKLEPGEAFFVGKTKISFSVGGAMPVGAPIEALPPQQALEPTERIQAEATSKPGGGLGAPPIRAIPASALPAPREPVVAARAATPAGLPAAGLPPPRPASDRLGALPPPKPAGGPAHALHETHGDESSPIEGYQIFEKLGEGSMGMVYHARSTETGEPCVLKTVKFDGSTKDAIFFIREAQMGIKLRHPNIVQVIDFGEAGGLLFLAMEYADGGSLLDKLKRSGPLGSREALTHLFQIADALAYAGKRKIVHRDIKPANILLTRDGVPKLADFGLAKLMAQPSEMALTRMGETRGTPIYMPPELISSAADADSRADIYSLGATYYHALTGFHPFRANSVVEILRMVVEAEPAPIEERNPKVHALLISTIKRMMRKKREDRYQNAGELAEELIRIAPEIPND